MNSTRLPAGRARALAVMFVALLIAASMIVPSFALAAGTGTLRIEPVTTNTTPGGSFTVRLVANADVSISGAGGTVAFDNTRLQLTDVAKPTTPQTDDWTPLGASFTGFPNTAAQETTFINNANAAGKTGLIAPNFQDGSTNLPAGDHDVYQLTFQVIACGSSQLTLPIGATDGGILDGQAATYGEPVTITTVAGTVNAPCPTPTPEPTATPEPTPTPTPVSAAPANGTTNVTGTVDEGFLGITVPAEVSIPLERNADNTTTVPVVVFSNIVWDLAVHDTKLTNTGHMTDGSKVLADPMRATLEPHIVTLAASQASDDIFRTGAAHELEVGQRVRFQDKTPAAPANPAIVLGTTDYYVLASNFTATTFQLGLTPGGTAIDIAVNLTGAVLVTQHDQVNLETGGIVTDGANSANVPVQLRQFVNPADPPGSYSIALLFEAISAF